MYWTIFCEQNISDGTFWVQIGQLFEAHTWRTLNLKRSGSGAPRVMFWLMNFLEIMALFMCSMLTISVITYCVEIEQMKSASLVPNVLMIIN